MNIYNLQGKEIITLVDQNQNAGSYKTEFNAANLPGGVYFYKLNATNGSNVYRSEKRCC
ncbi:MAG: T9SS type A sorting domain-containing protein [Ignavibacteria bacterium]